MKTIKIRPNYFYVKKDISEDIGIIPTYADAYVGTTTTFDIKSNPDTSFYVAESQTVERSDFVYGDGTIKEMFLSLYANKVQQKNSQLPNYLDVFSLKPNIDITEGNLAITSGSYGGPVLLYNTHNTTIPWMSEDFDGTNKAFMDMPQSSKQMIGLGKAPLLVIKKKDIMALMYETNRDPPNKDKEWQWGEVWSNVAEEVGALIDWGGYYVGAAASMVGGKVGNFSQEDEYFVSKGTDGLYYADVTFDDSGDTLSSMAYSKRLEPLAYPAEWWLERGAKWWAESGLRPSADSSFDQFDEDFVVRCTQFNSIFSNIMYSPDIRDIKDQTLEGAGDTNRFISYTYANIVNSDAPTNGRALRLKSFWENYSGSFTDTEAVITANPFGYNTSPSYLNKGAFQQTTSMTIYGIPQPTPIDVTTSGTGFPAYAPEIEITFKIRDMDLTTQRASGSLFTSGTGAPSLDRSFSIWFHDSAPAGAADTDSGPGATQLGSASELWRYYGDFYGINRFAPAIIFMNEDPENQYVSCYTNQNVFNTKLGYYFKRGDGIWPAGNQLVNNEDYLVKVPVGEWVRMRIKLNMYDNTGTTSTGSMPNASGGGSLVYFPDLMDDNGQYKFAPLAHAGSWGQNLWGVTSSGGTSVGNIALSGNNAHFPNMTFWVNNMRAINEIPAASGGTGIDYLHINNTYTDNDSIPDDDKTVDVLIDNITFHQWGPDVTNSTICTENGMGRLTKIPAGNFVTPVIYPGDNTTPGYLGRISVYPTGSGAVQSDNYYGKESALTASYMSFGFEEKTQISNNTTDANNLLFNNFSTGVEESVKPITMVSGGFFTAANYLGLFGSGNQNGWFDNLTVGDNTKNIQITGDANSVDGFTQKGLVKVKSPFTSWVKTGNPLASATVISASDDGFKVVVNNPEIFDIPIDTPLCVELNNTTYEYLAVGSGSIGYYDVLPAGTFGKDVPLVQTHKRRGNTIFLSRPIYTDDARCPAYGTYDFSWNAVRSPAGSGSASEGGIQRIMSNTNFNLTKCRISPYKYWMNMALINASSSAGWGNSFADTTHSGTTLLSTRTYDGIVPVSGGSVAGTTYNEFLFNDGVYANRWNMSLTDPIASVINLNTDYGFGALDNTNNNQSVPDSDGGQGRMGREYIVSGQNYINIGSYAYTTKPDFNTPFNFLIKPTYMNFYDGSYNCNINTKDALTDKPLIIYGINDPIPVCSDLTVSPNMNVLGVESPVQIAKATKSQATDLLIEWSEGDKDINYRILWIDTQNIDNKYHRANFIAPLNENSTTVSYYTSAANYLRGTGVAMTGTNVPDIEGACGYAFSTNGSGPGVSSSTGVTLGSTDEFTFTCQAKPNTLAALNHGCIFNASSSTTIHKFDFFVGTYPDGAVKVYVNEVANVMESTTKYDLDGKQPIAIVVTYNKNLPANNLKLYINGKLEDTKDYTTNFACGGATNTVNIGDRIQDGGTGGYSRFNGTIDEITFHDKCAYVPTNNNKHILKTSQLPDLTAGASNKYQARLFLFDYHNIRGASPQDVCRSNTASWKISGVN
tara:strand:+ start:693 stop:5306 length:4614 start_codon:yes stop_codon:yes gene_type:complete